MGHDTLNSGDETLNLCNDTLNSSDETLNSLDDTLNLGHDTLNSSDETLNLGDDTLNSSDETLNLDHDTLNSSDETLNLGHETLNSGNETVNFPPPAHTRWRFVCLTAHSIIAMLVGFPARRRPTPQRSKPVVSFRNKRHVQAADRQEHFAFLPGTERQGRTIKCQVLHT